MKNKRGISLIVLIITIIVIAILAATVIISMNKNNPISSSKEAKFKSDISAIQTELEMYKANNIIANEDVINITADKDTNPSIKEIIPSINDKYANILKIEKGLRLYKV